MKQKHKKLNNLRKYRRSRGLRQGDVANILGVKSTGMISRWEKGVCLPDSLNMFKMAIIYRTMVDALYIDLIIILRDELRSKEEEVLKNGVRETQSTKGKKAPE